MANYSRWETIKKQRGEPSEETRAGIEQDLALGQLIYDLRRGANLSQRELAQRMGTTQSVSPGSKRAEVHETESTPLPGSRRLWGATWWCRFPSRSLTASKTQCKSHDQLVGGSTRRAVPARGTRESHGNRPPSYRRSPGRGWASELTAGV